MANVKITGGTKVYVKRKPIKAGSTHGGILNAKMAATVRRRKRKK